MPSGTGVLNWEVDGLTENSAVISSILQCVPIGVIFGPF